MGISRTTEIFNVRGLLSSLAYQRESFRALSLRSISAADVRREPGDLLDAALVYQLQPARVPLYAME